MSLFFTSLLNNSQLQCSNGPTLEHKWRLLQKPVISMANIYPLKLGGLFFYLLFKKKKKLELINSCSKN